MKEDPSLGCPWAAFPISSCREGVEKVVGELSLSSEELAFGKTKIFIRSPKTVSWRGHLCLAGLGSSRVGEAMSERLGWRGASVTGDGWWVRKSAHGRDFIAGTGINPWAPALPCTLAVRGLHGAR